MNIYRSRILQLSARASLSPKSTFVIHLSASDKFHKDCFLQSLLEHHSTWRKTMIKKISSNTSKWSVLGVSLASILFSLLLIYSPTVKAEVGGVDVTCSDGQKVFCSGYKCTGKDGVGCSCTNADGTKGQSQSCSGLKSVSLFYVGGDY